MSAEFMQQCVNWLTLGSTYALIALGFSLLFGVLKIIHFSHGDVSLLAPFFALAAVQATSVQIGSATGSLLAACAIAILATGAAGVLLDWLVIRRFRNAPPMMALVATVALGIVLRELIRHLFPNGSNPHAFPQIVSGRLPVGGIELPAFSLLTLSVSILAGGALFALLHKTWLGVQIRAVSQDREAARLMAIKPNRIFWITFFIASAVGAVGGLFQAGYAGVVRFDFSIQAGLIGFSAAVIGGLGSMGGAVIGSLLIAGIETLMMALLPSASAYRLVAIFLLVILILVFKPAGLFGRVAIEKV